MAEAPPAVPPRLVTLDFLRGVAVLGILTMNIVGFAWPEGASLVPNAPGGPRGPGDESVFLTGFVLFDGKMRGLFSLLFGASMALLAGRARAAGEDAVTVQHRRLAWLAAFGLAHFYLLWWGDILFLYAVCGFGALGMIDWPARRQIALALPLYAAGALWLAYLTIGEALPWLGGSEEARATEAAEMARRFAADAAEEMRVTLGSWPDMVAHQVATRADWPLTTVLTSAPETIALMLIGMALLRSGLLAGDWPPRRMRALAAWTIGAGLIATVPLALWLEATDYPLPLARLIAVSLAAPGRLAMTVGYAALLVLLAPRITRTRLGERIVAAGRMAFSNYLGTSLVMTALFHGWGLGLFGRFSQLELIGFLLFGWALMLAWSKPWLARFRHGPLEWLWRCLTQGRVVPIRRLATATDSH